MRVFLRSKIHKATVTEANLEYVGSVTIDQELLERAGIAEYEKVLIVDNTNGARLETYALAGEPGSGVVCINGAAAHLVRAGDEEAAVATTRAYYERVDRQLMALLHGLAGSSPSAAQADGERADGERGESELPPESSAPDVAEEDLHEERGATTH